MRQEPLMRVLVFAGNMHEVRNWMHKTGLRRQDITYVGSPHVLRGMKTHGLPRVFLPGFYRRRDYSDMIECLKVSDLSGNASPADVTGVSVSDVSHDINR